MARSKTKRDGTGKPLSLRQGGLKSQHHSRQKTYREASYVRPPGDSALIGLPQRACAAHLSKHNLHARQRHWRYLCNYLGGGSGSPAVLTGSTVGTGGNVHNENGALQFFANPTTVLEQFSNPLAGQSGSRNDLRGPGYWTVDAALLKNIRLTERLGLQFRAEAFNMFNRENFNPPNTNINSSTFGVLSSTAGEGPRQMQIALRLEF